MPPRRDALEVLHRLLAGAQAGRAPLRPVAREQAFAAPALDPRRELPAEVDRIGDAGIHSESAVGRHDMHRVAGEEHAAAAVALRDEVAPHPYADGQDLELEVTPHRLAHRLARLELVLVDHEAPLLAAVRR